MKKVNYVFGQTTLPTAKATILDQVSKLEGVTAYLSSDKLSINISVPSDTSDDDLVKIGATIATLEIAGFAAEAVSN